ncbi:rifin PIR protein, putative [Plasmodium reichenowi]|uniref:Rifin PIR protein, putative n=1 Tax=Plasmodium reichenowi TaxID=5854 RepID=A0A2P9D8L8_PLARE|nr:rifin PIR protein, putative [Plasmodium reichenowi]
MKVYYINILLFALTLNILVNIKMNHNITTLHTPSNRSLCECELYAPVNYDNDPEIKKIMQQFDDRTSQRLREYDDRMKEKRMQCKEQCDKEIQKIILKDKLEKQMAQQLTTLETKIDTDDIPTCICEKSIADKVEKRCLQCGSMLGGTLPELGLMGGTALYTLNAWKVAALEAAIDFATKAGIKAGIKAGAAEGVYKVFYELQELGVHTLFPDSFESIFSKTPYNNASKIINIIIQQHEAKCTSLENGITAGCSRFQLKVGIRTLGSDTTIGAKEPITEKVTELVEKATQAAAEVTETTTNNVTAQITTEKTNVINTIFMSNQTAIIASVAAIVVIISIMVIIYLILRYRRKKKMKKKLQYIKLLEE